MRAITLTFNTGMRMLFNFKKANFGLMKKSGLVRSMMSSVQFAGFSSSDKGKCEEQKCDQEKCTEHHHCTNQGECQGEKCPNHTTCPNRGGKIECQGENCPDHSACSSKENSSDKAQDCCSSKDQCSHSHSQDQSEEEPLNCGCSSHMNKKPTKQDEIETKLKIMHYRILECINLGNYDDALLLSDDFIDVVKTNFGDDHPFHCSALNNKAFILKTCGKFDEAITIFQDVVDKYRQNYGDSSDKVIITLHNLATVLKEAQQFEKSLEIYEKILKTINKEDIIFEADDSAKTKLNLFASIYNSAGGLYRQLKNYKEADKLFALAYSIIKENFGEDTPPMATVFNNMGLSLKDQGKFDEAMEKYVKALEIRKGHLDESHPEVWMVQHNIEQLQNEMGKKDLPNSNKNI